MMEMWGSISKLFVYDLVLFGSQPNCYNIFILVMYQKEGETLGCPVHQTI